MTKNFPEICRGYNDEQIFKLTPDKTLQFTGEKCNGGKRITVMVVTNMIGTNKRWLLGNVRTNWSKN